jgi:hypothetical protein
MQPYMPVAIAVFFLLLFRVCVGSCPSPTLLWSVLVFSHCYKPFLLHAHWGRYCHSCLLWPACLFTVQVKSAPPPLSGAQGTLTSLLRVFFILLYFIFCSAACLLFSLFFSLFSLGGGQSVQGAMLIYHVPLSSPGDLCFSSSLGAGIWQCGSPPGFSI